MSDEQIPIDPSTPLGSERLALALRENDVLAIGRALRHDYVVVPLTRGESGQTQTRVYSLDDPAAGQPPWALYVFSSAETFSTFVADGPDREFAMQRGTSLGPILTEYAALIGLVVFDAAGPFPMTAVPGDVMLSLEPQPGDDDVAWIAGDA